MAAAPPPYQAVARPQKELKLDRRKFEELATFASIIRALDLIESSVKEEWIDPVQYKQAASRYLKMHDNTKKVLQAKQAAIPFQDTETFLDKYNYDCAHARQRIKDGVIENYDGDGASKSSRADATITFELAQYFVTASDAIEMDMRAVDEILPFVTDLVTCIKKIGAIPPDHPAFKAKTKLTDWNVKLRAMRASDELDDEQIRQLKLDIQFAKDQMYEFIQQA